MIKALSPSLDLVAMNEMVFKDGFRATGSALFSLPSRPFDFMYLCLS